MKRFVLLIIFAATTFQLSAQNEVTTFILVRHAEKGKDDPRDPNLNEEGIKRAQALNTLLAQADVAALYSSPYKRTKSSSVDTGYRCARRSGFRRVCACKQDVGARYTRNA